MDFTFSAEQEALRDAVQGHLSRTLAPERVRRMIDDQLGFSEEWWAGITEMGWPGLMVPERLGGSGLGLIDAVVVQEEMGKKTAPGPFLSSAVCATLAALHLGEDDLLAQMASGRTRATVAIEEIGPGDPLASIEATGVPDGHEWVLSGAKPVVLDGHSAHVALVAARTSEGLATFVLDNPGGELIPGLDVTRKVA
ncbi:MAG: acyl-CoA dehydrogenase family protein, partial [Acidimicrobiales bacterium]